MICDSVEKRNRLTEYLPLVCPNHSDVVIEARCALDFAQCPHGGCKVVCGQSMDCGHNCTLLCHPISHDKINCMQTCRRPRPTGCTHSCRQVCFQPCEPCPTRVQKLRKKCGHTISLACHRDVDEGTCPAPCGQAMICGHNCSVSCSDGGHDPLRHKCQKSCDRTPLCGHPCKKKCFENCGTDFTYFHIP